VIPFDGSPAYCISTKVSNAYQVTADPAALILIFSLFLSLSLSLSLSKKPLVRGMLQKIRIK
jgi:hypothetical protein